VRKAVTSVTFIFAVALCLSGCMGKVRYPSYYTLSLPTPPDPPVQGASHAALAIREFRAPGYLRQGAIVYRESPEQVGFYNYHRWAVDPREFLTNAVADRLRGSGNFAVVRKYDGHSDVDYILSGRLEKLEEVDYQGGVHVEVAISADVINLHTGTTVWTNSVSEAGNLAQRNVPAVVAEMNRTINRAIEKLLATLPSSITTKGTNISQGDKESKK
jgi:ABC-type uncharacterized transport system auxiliary subunit